MAKKKRRGTETHEPELQSMHQRKLVQVVLFVTPLPVVLWMHTHLAYHFRSMDPKTKTTRSKRPCFRFFPSRKNELVVAATDGSNTYAYCEHVCAAGVWETRLYHRAKQLRKTASVFSLLGF